KAESHMQKDAVKKALQKANLTTNDIDFMFAGDLLNQCIGSSFGLREIDIALFGLYGACSTMAESLSLASIFVETGVANKTLCVTSSHFCSAERQFRYPLEYGGQRPPTAAWTVTGSGSLIIGTSSKPPYVKAVTIGKIKDLGITDINNMGAAMAPAAAYTIKTHLENTNTLPRDYDMIFTGDLGIIGSKLLFELLEKDNIDIKKNHCDCGKIIYDINKQDAHSGGSGCGCAASVLCSFILKKLISGEFANILFVATGALMSPTSICQGESIPGIAHLVHIGNSKWK
ncbi:MAG: stage V sporulation protein AD, partial [Oscillospiraceae bacterium]